MRRYFDYPYTRPEQLNGSHIIATYVIFGTGYENILDRAGNFAVGQTIGTWVDIPGISRDMVERYQGRIIAVYSMPAENEQAFILRVAFPLDNIESSFTMLMTALVGNDVSTALQTKLIDIELGAAAEKAFRGPRQGMDELRKLTGVYGRPIVLNMIKPCTGFSPEEGAKLFYESASGGVDIIKDDELLGSTSYSSVQKRVELYNKAARRVFEETGKQTVYMVNISDTPKKMRENAKKAIEAGAKAAMVNFVFGGLDALAEICEEFGDKLFIMSHYAGVGVMNWDRGGIDNSVGIGILPRLAGAHAIMTMYPPRNNPKAMYEFYRTVQSQKLPLGNIKKVVTAVGGGVTPVNQAVLQKDLGNDIIIGVGGAIQGHPMGTTAGAKAVMAAVKATSEGISLEDAAAGCEELQVALKTWQ
ncbi:MAG: RuBisCO large subunit C-terminal-like domain-containing protein [Bacillota bacterium]